MYVDKLDNIAVEFIYVYLNTITCKLAYTFLAAHSTVSDQNRIEHKSSDHLWTIGLCMHEGGGVGGLRSITETGYLYS